MLNIKNSLACIALGTLVSTTVCTQQAATMQAQLMNAIESHDVEGFKNISELNKEDITQQMLLELKMYARFLRAFKVTELSQTVDSSQTWALPKAIAQGLVALYTLNPFYTYEYRDTSSEYTGYGISYSSQTRPALGLNINHLQRPKTTTYLGAFCAYCAYHNAKLYWYGNELVLADIENLDAIINYIEKFEQTLN